MMMKTVGEVVIIRTDIDSARTLTVVSASWYFAMGARQACHLLNHQLELLDELAIFNPRNRMTIKVLFIGSFTSSNFLLEYHSLLGVQYSPTDNRL